MKEALERKNEEYFAELQAAIGQGLVLTDLQEIYRACQEGKADFLIVQESFHQSAKIISDIEIEIVDSNLGKSTVDDISSLLALLINEKGGKTCYVSEIPNSELRPIALKIRH